MAKVRTPIYAFNGGEISRRMEGRTDLDGIHDRALAKMFNFVATVEGPATKRSGFRYIVAAALSSTWLSRFVFNSTQSYVLEWGELAVRFFTNGGQIQAAGAPYEVAVPYAAADAPRISSKQSYDRLYLAHAGYAPGMLTRTGAEAFTYGAIPLKDGPFKDWNTDRTKTITWAGDGTVGGLATITANFDLFQPGHVGSPFIFEVVAFSELPAWEPVVKTVLNDDASRINVGTIVRSDGKAYKCVDLGGSSYTGTIEPTHTTGAEWDGSQCTALGQDDGHNCGVKWEYLYDRFGIGTVSTVLSSTTAELTVTRAFPTLSVATWHWAQAAFSNVEGWPQLVTIWGGRLCFIKGVEIAGSVVGDYFNFLPVNESGDFSDDMAFRLSLDISDPPTWVHADKEYLLLGTHSEEIVVGQTNRAAGISRANLNAQPQSAYGSSNTWPIPIGPSVLFLQRGGRKIREATFDYDQGRFVAVNANIYARHITRSGIDWLAYQSEPEDMLWGGRGDGTLIAHPHNPDQAVKGFSRNEIASGEAVSGVAIPSDDGGRDELWILADLLPVAPGGATQRAIVKLEDYWDEDLGLELADAFFVDWGVSYDGTELDELGAPLGPKQDFTVGLEHLEGRQVRILYDGIEINNLTVTGGAISLPKPAMKVAIGLGYEARLKLLRAEARGTPTIQGLRKRALRLFARLIDSASPVVLNRLGEAMRFFNRKNDSAMDTPAPLFNGDTDNIAIGGGGSDYDDAPEIVSDNALPAIISLLVPTYEIEELPQ
jgi:hypothetical protein